MCKNTVSDVLRFEAIAALMRAENIDLNNKEAVIMSLKETVAAKPNIECYLRIYEQQVA